MRYPIDQPSAVSVRSHRDCRRADIKRNEVPQGFGGKINDIDVASGHVIQARTVGADGHGGATGGRKDWSKCINDGRSLGVHGDKEAVGEKAKEIDSRCDWIGESRTPANPTYKED